MGTFKIIVLTPAGELDPSLALAASRAGEIGILNFESFLDSCMAKENIKQLADHAKNDVGLKLDCQAVEFLSEIRKFLSELRPDHVNYIILTAGAGQEVSQAISSFQDLGLRVYPEILTFEQALLAQKLGADGLVAKGHEAGGWIGEETSFVLLQRILSQIKLPVWIQGGIGLHTAAACYGAGAEGVVLDTQLLLTKDSPLPEEIKTRLASLDGSETICLGERFLAPYRVYGKPQLPLIKELLSEEEHINSNSSLDPAGKMRAWRQLIQQHTGWKSLEKNLMPIGQDISLASSMAKQFGTVGGIVQAIRRSIQQHMGLVTPNFLFAKESPLARTHGTLYPLVQGPMARISDVPDFALKVAGHGSLPFIELAMMPGDKAGALLFECKKTLADYPFGVGILGFISPAILKGQQEAIMAHKPSYVLIAGGRPEQVKNFEQQGIPAYIHCPSPELLKIFLKEGLRKFVFEGMESGGHIGPRSSFILWEKSIEVLLGFLSARNDASSYQILFAGGIHDSLSSMMVSLLAAPLAALGVQIGLQIGSAYLFCEEAVSTGAMVKGFQKNILAAQGTVRLEASPGYVTRCLATPSAKLFLQERQRMILEGRSINEVRDTLESMNLGRLRIAAKGMDRQSAQIEGGTQYFPVSEEEQVEKGIYMIGQICALHDRIVNIEELHKDICEKGAKKLKKLVEAHQKKSSSLKVAETKMPEIAIIGMACILPKAQGLSTYWENILNKLKAVGEIPPDKWDHQIYYHQDRKARDKIYSKWGAFIDDVIFDPMVFGMPPNTLHSIEPLHLITLQVVREAIKDAGYLDRVFSRDRTSVIIGAGGGVADLGIKYSIRSFLPLLERASNGKIKAESSIAALNHFLPEWTEDSFPGILMNVAAGRVANRFDFGGSNFTVDAACASSMAALYLAVKELQTYSSDMVVVGGSDTMQNPFTYLCFSKTQALSPTGNSHPLDESADGIVLGEGVGMAVLKRLADAQRDGDRIYAVIKAVGSSSDGRDKCLTAPRVEGQILALQRAYSQAGISPSTISLIEAHGTGTIVGDRAEVDALTKVFQSSQAKTQNCAIGSVKSMIGHTKCTAGIASLIKVAMALYSKVLPPTIGVSQPNKKANFKQTPFYVNTEERPWINSGKDHPRRAGVSAFGFGGTNFHTILEEYIDLGAQDKKESLYKQWPSELCMWQAKSGEDLYQKITKTLEYIGQHSGASLCKVAYSQWKQIKSQAEQTGHHIRLAVIAGSIEDLVRKLEQVKKYLSSQSPVLHISDPQGIYLAEEKISIKGKIAFLFPGQGSQYPNMVRDLAIHFPTVLSSFERMDNILQPKLREPLSHYIFPIPVFTDQERSQQKEVLTQTRIAQPAIAAVSVALGQLLVHFGLSPDMVAGHSFGEFVALWAAGSLTEESLMLLSEARGRVIEETVASCPGSMAAIKSSDEDLAKIISEKEGVWIANYNSPQQTVISGKSATVQEIVGLLQSSGMQGKILPVACAFHSPLVQPAQEAFASVLKTIPLGEAKIPVYSNSTASPHQSDPKEIRQQMINHLISPVRFKQEIGAMYEAGARIFIEIGPKNVLTNLIDQILAGVPHISLALDQPGRHSLIHLQHCLGQMAVHGISINMDRLYQNRIEQEIDWLREENQSAKSPLPPTAWLIRGDRIRPAHGISDKKREKESKLIGQKEERAMDKKEEMVMASGLGLPAGASDQVMCKFQEMMNKFLETQKMVMLQYLQTNSFSSQSRQEGFPGEFSGEVKRNKEIKEEELKMGFQEPEKLIPVTQETMIKEELAPKGSTLQEESTARELTQEACKELLLKVVSERTGYPREMLNLNLDMEADLGIDSIKRVEILGGFQREISSSFQDQNLDREMEKLGGIKTLQGIIDWVVQSRQEEKRLEIKSESIIKKESKLTEDKQIQIQSQNKTPQSQAPDGIQRFTLEKREINCQKNQISLAKDKVIVITEDRDNLASLLGYELKAQGYKVAMVKMGEGVIEIEPGIYKADLGEYESVKSVLQLIHQQQGTPGHLIHLYPFKNSHSIYQMDLESWKKLLHREVKSLFYFAKSMEQELKDAALSSGSCLIAVTSMGGSFGSLDLSVDRENFSPGKGGCTGLLKSLKYEWPEINLKAVDLDPNEEMRSLVRYLMDEIHGGIDEVEVCYSQGHRFVLQPVLSPVGHESQIQPDSSWVILITGGARGVTADVARELARQYQPTMILVGSSAFPNENPPFSLNGSMQEIKAGLIEHMKQGGEQITPAKIESKYQQLMKAKEIRDNIKDIEDLGARVLYRQADVRDEKAMAGLIDEIYQSYGKIDGVIHGAGIIEDKFIRDKAPESFDRVFDTKVDSAFILSHKLHFDSLKFLIFFTSVAGRFGNRGQGDYAAANEIVNKLAIYLDARWPARIVAINWGPWENSNMVPAFLQKEFTKHGVQLVSRSCGPKRLDQEIIYGRKGEVEIIIGGGGWENRLKSQKSEVRSQNNGASLITPDSLLMSPDSGQPKRRSKPGFPLLQSGLALSADKEGKFELIHELDTGRDLYLLDHQLDGKPVLPMAMALELMAEVAALGWPNRQLSRVYDLRVLQGIIVSEPVKLHIIATSSPSASSEVLTIQVEIKNLDTSSRGHYSTMIEMREKMNGQITWEPPNLAEAKPFPMKPHDAFQKWLFHGPLFQGISEIHEIGANGIQGVLIPSKPEKLIAGHPEGNWLIDPVILDSGLQMIILWSRTYWDMMPLPSRFQQLRRFGSLSESARIRFQSRILPKSVPGMIHADLAFFNEEGKLIALLEDMEAACSKSLNRLSEKK